MLSHLNPNLQKAIEQIQGMEINEKRKQILSHLAEHIKEEADSKGHHNVIFICTHNSRRSHIADGWFRTGLLLNQIESVKSYSGGTEATSFNPNAIAALERVGFSVASDQESSNPTIYISPSDKVQWPMFSKAYGEGDNPRSNFTAVMVCSDADQGCPVILGASRRFSLPYDDPRHGEGTPEKDLRYDECVETIGKEILYLTKIMSTL
jgi:hypothetical protein